MAQELKYSSGGHMRISAGYKPGNMAAFIYKGTKRKRKKTISDYKIEVDAHPFSWNDKMAPLAIEDFDSIRNELPYCQCQSIGLALAKLRMIEDGEINV